MKNTTITKILVLSISLAVAGTTALAQPFPGETWSLDENGNGILSAPPGSGPNGIVGLVQGTMQVEPISGITTLFYNFTFPFAGGDVLLLEPPSTSQGSCLLRFDGHSGVYFFSDAEPGAPDGGLADVGVPAAINPVIVAEIRL